MYSTISLYQYGLTGILFAESQVNAKVILLYYCSNCSSFGYCTLYTERLTDIHRVGRRDTQTHVHIHKKHINTHIRNFHFDTIKMLEVHLDFPAPAVRKVYSFK